METPQTTEEHQTLLMKVHEQKKPILSWPLEIILQAGSVFMATGIIMIAAVDEPETVDMTYALIAVCAYYAGALLVTIGGFIGVLHARQHNEFGWFLTLFLGTLLSTWNGVIDSFISSKSMIIFYAICGAGCLLECISISQITIFRHDQYRAFWKAGIMVGLILCHIMTIVDIRSYRMVLLCIGIGIVSLSYIIGRVRSRHSELHGMKHLSVSLNA